MNIKKSVTLADTRYATHKALLYHINVCDYGATPDAVTDNTEAFQAAIDAAAALGGGTVFVPEGHYAFRGTLTVRQKVLLQGDFDATEDPVGCRGTCLYIYNRDESFLRLEVSSGVRQMAFWYPEQSLESVISYPATIEQLGSEIILAENLRFVNAYTAFDFRSP